MMPHGCQCHQEKGKRVFCFVFVCFFTCLFCFDLFLLLKFFVVVNCSSDRKIEGDQGVSRIGVYDMKLLKNQ